MVVGEIVATEVGVSFITLSWAILLLTNSVFRFDPIIYPMVPARINPNSTPAITNIFVFSV